MAEKTLADIGHEEFIGELAMIGHINPDTSYDDIVDVHRRFQSFMKEFVIPRIRSLKGESDGWN